MEGWSRSRADRPGTRAFIAHGRRDPVIKVGVARGAREQLEAAGLPVEHDESEAGHIIDPISLRNAISWLAGVIPPAADR